MQKQVVKFKQLMTQLGMSPVSTDFGLIQPFSSIPVMLDGQLLGSVDNKIASKLVNSLRAIKIQQQYPDKCFEGIVPRTLEIAFLPPAEKIDEDKVKDKFFPGIFLSSQPARFVRPVKNLEHGGIEFIGPLEQVNLSIAV